MTGDKKIIIIAGPNGAGKTTFARQFLPKEADCPTFINADLIAAGLAPFSPESAAIRAGRMMLEEIDKHVTRTLPVKWRRERMPFSRTFSRNILPLTLTLLSCDQGCR